MRTPPARPSPRKGTGILFWGLAGMLFLAVSYHLATVSTPAEQSLSYAPTMAAYGLGGLLVGVLIGILGARASPATSARSTKIATWVFAIAATLTILVFWPAM